MQKSFHINKRYAHLIGFLEEKENLSAYLCELVELDYFNRINSLQTMDLVEVVFQRMEKTFSQAIKQETSSMDALVSSTDTLVKEVQSLTDQLKESEYLNLSKKEAH